MFPPKRSRALQNIGQGTATCWPNACVQWHHHPAMLVPSKSSQWHWPGVIILPTKTMHHFKGSPSKWPSICIVWSPQNGYSPCWLKWNFQRCSDKMSPHPCGSTVLQNQHWIVQRSFFIGIFGSQGGDSQFLPSCFQKSHPTPTTNNEVNQEGVIFKGQFWLLILRFKFCGPLVSGVNFRGGSQDSHDIHDSCHKTPRANCLKCTICLGNFLSLATHSKYHQEGTHKWPSNARPTNKKKPHASRFTMTKKITMTTCRFPNFTLPVFPLSFNEPPEQIIITKLEVRLGLLYFRFF